MDFRFSQFEILTGAATLLLCLFFVCVFSEVGAIENDLAAAVIAEVEDHELYWSGVEVSGRNITLTGSAPDVPARNRALARAQKVPGVWMIDNEIEVIGGAGTCQSQLDDYLAKETIRFKTGRADISESSFHSLGMLAMIVRSCKARLEIAGHTDGRGDAQINLKLSQRRADAVARQLVRYGVEASQLHPVGYGESQPIADNRTDAGRRKNRRIEFRVLGGTV